MLIFLIRLVPFLNRELLALLEGTPHATRQADLVNSITELITRLVSKQIGLYQM